MARLCDPEARVSSHYTVDEDGTIYQHVPENSRAWHAGVSYWAGARDINARSIGIEVVNPGHEFGYRAFPGRQVETVIALAREIVRQPALQKYSPIEYLPGPQVRDDDEKGLVKSAGDIGTTIFHPVGTAKMGLPSDPAAVVDERLRVMGLQGLRVIDASVMPTLTTGNTNAPTLMVAERAADFILHRRLGVAP